MYPQRACPHPYGSFVANGCDRFLVFKPQDWRKRSVARGRGFIQRFPKYSTLTLYSTSSIATDQFLNV